MTINGIGIRFLACKVGENKQVHISYQWFTFLYLPIYPIKRIQYKWKWKESNELQMADIVEMGLIPKEVFLTYIKGWLFYPILIFSPIILVIREIYEAMELPKNYYNMAIGFAIGYLIIIIWILSYKYDKRCIPQNEKHIIGERKQQEE